MPTPSRLSRDPYETVPSLADARARHHVASSKARRLLHERRGTGPSRPRSAEQDRADAEAAIAEQEYDRLRRLAWARHLTLVAPSANESAGADPGPGS